MILELQFVNDKRIFTGHCQEAFSYMEPFSFLVGLYKKVIVTCFSDSIVQKTNEQSYGSCYVTSDSQLLYKLFNKQPLYF